jgi:predicted nucleic acid-binding protein
LSTEPPLVLDTDFVSSFAWVDRMEIIEGLYSNRMIVLEEVMVELERARHLADRVCFSIMHGPIRRMEMMVGSAEALEYIRLHDSDRYGSGEAACMAYAYYHDGIVASNNLRDVKRYCGDRKIQLLTTADVLMQVYEEERLDLNRVDSIWRRMVEKRNRLPAASFAEYLASTRA